MAEEENKKSSPNNRHTNESGPIPSSVIKVNNQLDDQIGRLMYNVDPADLKSVPDDDLNTDLDNINTRVSQILIPNNNNAGEDNIIDAIARVNLANNRNLTGSGRATASNINAEEKSLLSELQEGLSGATTDDEANRISRYDDYDTLDTSIPELTTALNVYTDSIMSPDDVNKKSIGYYYKDPTEANIENNENSQFHHNMERLLEKFEINEKMSSRVRDALKYGDLFIMVLDMHKKANMYLNEATLGSDGLPLDEGNTVLSENLSSKEDNVLLERLLDNLSKEDYSEYRKGDRSQNELFDRNGHIKIDNTSVKRSILDATRMDIADRINQNVKFFNQPESLVGHSSGLENDPSLSANNVKEINYHFSGAFVKDLNPRNVIKLEVDGVCLGYLYFEEDASNLSGANSNGEYTSSGMMSSGSSSMLSMLSQTMTNGSSVTTTTTTSSSSSSSGSSESTSLKGTEYTNTALRYSIITDLFIKGISKKIGKNFIRKNKELTATIFDLVRRDYILNKEVRITYLQPDEVFHLKIDSTTTYGTSRLASSVFPAKLYLSTLLTNVIVKVTRGRDRKVYYIETGLDDDIEGTVQGLIRDMKSDEFGVGNLSSDKSISTMFKQVGVGSDMYVPVINGEAPFNIDTISGEQVDINDDFLDSLKKSVMNSTGVPATYIDASQEVDYARSLAMQNNGFVRNVIRYQGVMGTFFSKVVRRIYDIEYDTIATLNDRQRKELLDKQRDIVTGKRKDALSVNELDKLIDTDFIFLQFPAPIFMNIQNVNEQISNITQTIDFLTSTYIDDNSQDPNINTVKMNFKRNLAEKFLQTLDWKEFDKLYDDALEKTTADAISVENDVSNQMANDMGGDDSDGGYGGGF